jgi:hypothetical protein
LRGDAEQSEMVYHYGRDHLSREEQAYRRRGHQAGVRTIEAHTKKAPSRPPSHIHQGAFMMGPSSGTDRRTTAAVAKRITVRTRAPLPEQATDDLAQLAVDGELRWCGHPSGERHG